MSRTHIVVLAVLGCIGAVGCGGSNQPANDPSGSTNTGSADTSKGAGMTGGPTEDNPSAAPGTGSNATGTGTPGTGTGTGSGSGSGSAGH